MTFMFALVGSGEFLPVMASIDRELLKGRKPSVAVIPTASAQDGEARFQHWISLARKHYAPMGVDVRGIEVRDRSEAENFTNLDDISTAGLVYLSGGNPGFLASALRNTPVWAAIESAAHNGAAIAGCSAGAMAMGALAPIVREPEAIMGPGIGMIPNIAVIPHFDQIRGWVPGIVERYLEHAGAGVSVVGIDESTALIGSPGDWVVRGDQNVHLIRSVNEVDVYGPGDRLRI